MTFFWGIWDTIRETGSCQHKSMLQSKWQFRCHYTRQFSCNLQCMAVARQVANKIACVTPPPHNLSPNEKLCCELQEWGTSPPLFATLQVISKPVTFFSTTCNAMRPLALRCTLKEKLSRLKKLLQPFIFNK